MPWRAGPPPSCERGDETRESRAATRPGGGAHLGSRAARRNSAEAHTTSAARARRRRERTHATQRCSRAEIARVDADHDDAGRRGAVRLGPRGAQCAPHDGAARLRPRARVRRRRERRVRDRAEWRTALSRCPTTPLPQQRRRRSRNHARSARRACGARASTATVRSCCSRRRRQARRRIWRRNGCERRGGRAAGRPRRRSPRSSSRRTARRRSGPTASARSTARPSTGRRARARGARARPPLAGVAPPARAVRRQAAHRRPRGPRAHLVWPHAFVIDCYCLAPRDAAPDHAADVQRAAPAHRRRRRPRGLRVARRRRRPPIRATRRRAVEAAPPRRRHRISGGAPGNVRVGGGARPRFSGSPGAKEAVAADVRCLVGRRRRAYVLPREVFHGAARARALVPRRRGAHTTRPLRSSWLSVRRNCCSSSFGGRRLRCWTEAEPDAKARGTIALDAPSAAPAEADDDDDDDDG